MGNEGWILRQVSARPEKAERGIVEIGSGDGPLLRRLARLGLRRDATSPATAGLPTEIDWRQGDLFTMAEPITGGILVANLILHHFETESLRRIGAIAAGFETVIFVEPHRCRSGLALATLLLPFVCDVTGTTCP